MKKFLAIVLSMIMAISLVACASDPVETPADDIISNVETNTPAENTPIDPDSDVANILNITEPIVIVDNEFIKFSVKSAVYDEFWETYGLKVYLENKTDKPVMFSWDEVSVNGFMCDPFWASEVAGGKKENTEICWSLTSFEENEIDYANISEIEFKLSAYSTDEETWDSTYYVEDVFTLNFTN